MQIACPNCTTSYEITASALGEVGRMVRCVRCKEQWFARTPVREMADAGSDDTSNAREAGPYSERSKGGAVNGGWTNSAGQWSADAAAEETIPSLLARAEDEVEFATPREPAVVEDAPATSPYREDESLGHAGERVPEASADPDTGPDYFEIRRRQQTRGAKKGKHATGPLVTVPRAIAAMTGLIACLTFMRADVVRLLPQTASLYAAVGLPVNLRGLVFEDVKTVTEEQDGVPVLKIEGTIRNITRWPVDVPQLRFAMQNNAGADIYSWTAVAERPRLHPGESLAFHTRLASPPGESKGVYVRFVQRRDSVTSSH